MSLEDDIKTEAYFYIDARGTIIKISSALAMQSPVLEAWITNWRKNSKEAFYVDYKPKDVHKLLDSLQKSNVRDFLMYNTPSLKFYEEFDVKSLENLDIDVKLETVEKGDNSEDKYVILNLGEITPIPAMMKIKDKLFRLIFVEELLGAYIGTSREKGTPKYSKGIFAVNVHCKGHLKYVVNGHQYISLKYVKEQIFETILSSSILMKEIYGVELIK